MKQASVLVFSSSARRTIASDRSRSRQLNLYSNKDLTPLDRKLKEELMNKKNWLWPGCILMILISGCVSIKMVEPDPAAIETQVNVGVTNVIGPSPSEPGVELKFDETVMSLDPDTSDLVGFEVPPSTAPGDHSIKVTDKPGLLEILSFVLLFRDRTDEAILRVAPDVMVINMIPKSLSGETEQDSEPFIAINPANPKLMIGSAFTPSPNAPCTDCSVMYVSSDGGLTWYLNPIVPGGAFISPGVLDQTYSFDSEGSDLYGGIVDTTVSMILSHTQDITSATVMRRLDVQGFFDLQLLNFVLHDQPFVRARTVAGSDGIYVGENTLAIGCPGKTATVRMSTDGGAAFTSVVVEFRDTGPVCQDAPSVRPAIGTDGTVYVAFMGWRSEGTGLTGEKLLNGDVVVVRDDNRGAGMNPFQDLLGTDGLPGRRVAQNRSFPWTEVTSTNPGRHLGQERYGSSLSLAVDPNNSSNLYIAWADRISTDDYTVHVRRSTDRGVSWSSDLLTITNAICPALAINDNGTVGFFYQQLTTDPSGNLRWESHLVQTTDAFTTKDDKILSTVPADSPVRTFDPYLGDYAHLEASGLWFVGVFSANNTPNTSNFPHGVVYQRNADFSTETLLDVDNTTPVDISIDPFFFRVKALAP